MDEADEQDSGRLNAAIAEVTGWEQAGVPRELGVAIARCRLLPFAPYLAGVSARTGGSVASLVTAVGALRRSLPLDVLQGLISGLPSGTRVARWANQALRDDYLSSVSRLAGLAIADETADDPASAVESGIERRDSACAGSRCSSARRSSPSTRRWRAPRSRCGSCASSRAGLTRRRNGSAPR